MTPIAQAFSELTEAQQIDIVNTHIGNELFSCVAAANGTELEKQETLNKIKAIRESRLVAALPADKQASIQKLCNDAQELIEMDPDAED